MDGADARIKKIQRDDGLATGIDQLTLNFPLDVEGIRGRDNRAGLQRTVIGNDRLRNIGQHERDPITCFHAEPAQSERESSGQIVQFTVTKCARRKRRAQVIRETARRSGEEDPGLSIPDRRR